MSSLKVLDQWKCFGGVVRKYVHFSSSTRTDMKFSVFLPAEAASAEKKVPVIYFLSGLTCNEDNFITKAGAQRAASAHQVALVCPDTSPRGVGIPDESKDWDFGVGAGFYVSATQKPWSDNWQMYTYVTKELKALVEENLSVEKGKASIMGHSMGGHGALISYLKNPGLYASASAFSPICNPINCPWGQKAFTGYLGDEKKTWEDWDATSLLEKYEGPKTEILIDQGDKDSFLEKGQLLPENLLRVAEKVKYPVNYRLQKGYDHSYYFISTFVEDHIAFHSKHLQ